MRIAEHLQIQSDLLAAVQNIISCCTILDPRFIAVLKNNVKINSTRNDYYLTILAKSQYTNY